jgi:FkbH-like protein
MKLSDYILASKSLDLKNYEKKIRVAILSSYTVNGLSEILRVKCANSKINCSTYVGGYNQSAQEIFSDSSDLYKFDPNLTFLIIDTRKILGDYFFSPYSNSSKTRRNYIKTSLDQIKSLIQHFIKNSKSKLVITSLGIPTYSSYGIFESKTDYGLIEMVQDFNSQLRDFCKIESSVFYFDVNSFISKYGENNIFDYRQYYFGDIQISLNTIEEFAYELMGFIKPIMGVNRKCIVLDLDNTLWGGVIGEDGFEGIALAPNGKGASYMDFQKRLLALYERGIILAINSKNNPEDALEVIKNHPHMILRENHFASMKINWNDKVSNMKEIADEINIGLDSIVFFDDDQINREFVKTSLPQILTIDLPNDPSLYENILMNLNDFNLLKITNDDIQRGETYVHQRLRNDVKKMSNDLNEFLKNLETTIIINKADNFSIPRISQLTLKTNQFNLTTKRYQEEYISNLSKNNNYFVGCAQVEDKFGDNGITCVFIIDKTNSNEWNIDTFLLSCRVMGRKVEDAIMGYIINLAKHEGIKKIKANYIPSQKNKPCESFLSDLEFYKERDYWFFDTDNTFKIPNYISVKST